MLHCSSEVGPRRPRVKDTSNQIDYDVMSDQDWEEEPEGGESLSVPSPPSTPATLTVMPALSLTRLGSVTTHGCTHHIHAIEAPHKVVVKFSRD